MGIEPRASHTLGKGSSPEPQYVKYHSMVYHTLSTCPLRTTCYERTDASLSTRFQLVWGGIAVLCGNTYFKNYF